MGNFHEDLMLELSQDPKYKKAFLRMAKRAKRREAKEREENSERDVLKDFHRRLDNIEIARRSSQEK